MPNPVSCVATTFSVAPNYVGQIRAGTDPCATENQVIPAFLEMVVDQPPTFLAN